MYSLKGVDKMDIDRATENLELAIRNFISVYDNNSDRADIADTPKRFVKQLKECLAGYNDDPDKHIKVFGSDNFSDLIYVRDITFSSLCEHHLVPFFGTIDISYVPNGKILGLSKFARVIDSFSRRLQVQERLTEQITEFFNTKLEPNLLIVKISAKHTCMCSRGVRRHNSVTETIAIRGDINRYNHYVQTLVQKIH